MGGAPAAATLFVRDVNVRTDAKSAGGELEAALV